MNNYTDLGLSKQTCNLIQKTNGSAAARDLYTEATNMAVLVESPNKVTGANEIGVAIVTMHYVFSGQKNPLTTPLRALSTDITADEDPVLTARQEEKIKLI
jgi:hypothetical protein